jgi:hypothetical protein
MPNSDFTPGSASESVVSLSQVLLAPLDAIFKAQVHAARSFLNFLLQVSYPHRDQSELANLPEDELVYTQEFVHETTDWEGNTRRHRLSIPLLALVPLKPLAVQEATFKLQMAISQIDRHRQWSVSKKDTATEAPPPWYLVHDPISVRGVLAPRPTADAKDSNPVSIDIEVKVGPVPAPAALDKLVASMMPTARAVEPPSGAKPAPEEKAPSSN